MLTVLKFGERYEIDSPSYDGYEVIHHRFGDDKIHAVTIADLTEYNRTHEPVTANQVRIAASLCSKAAVFDLRAPKLGFAFSREDLLAIAVKRLLD